ncbi:hypothetical protein MMC18_000974 [Xylographa bjoerkii]|nr:hypothetical protein [Xylographa bjoerkii]
MAVHPVDDEEAPQLISRSLSLEHEVFVAYLKRFLGHKGIVSRLLETFPYLVEASGCNAHAKLFKKLDAIDFWMGIKGPSAEEVHEYQEMFAKLAAIDAWVGNYTSRWAPVQDPTEEMLCGYAWGPKLNMSDVEQTVVNADWGTRDMNINASKQHLNTLLGQIRVKYADLFKPVPETFAKKSLLELADDVKQDGEYEVNSACAVDRQCRPVMDGL